MEGPELKHIVPPGFSWKNMDVYFNQVNPTVKLFIRGDPKVYVVGGITKGMTPFDIFTKLINTVVTQYGE